MDVIFTFTAERSLPDTVKVRYSEDPTRQKQSPDPSVKTSYKESVDDGSRGCYVRIPKGPAKTEEQGENSNCNGSECVEDSLTRVCVN